MFGSLKWVSTCKSRSSAVGNYPITSCMKADEAFKIGLFISGLVS